MKRFTITAVLALVLMAGNAPEARAHGGGGGSFSFGVGLTFSWGFGCGPACAAPCYPPPSVYNAYHSGAAAAYGFGHGPAAWPGYGIGYAGYGY